MTWNRIIVARWLAAIALFGVVGCGGGSHPVHGKVVWSDGTPVTELTGGFVGFESPTEDLNARGDIDASGAFSLSNLKKDDGLPPGKYRVMVSPPEPIYSATASETSRGIKMLPMKYQRYETSGLEAIVEAKENEVTVTIDKVKEKS